MLMREQQQQKTELVDQVAERAAAGAGGRGDEVRLFSLQFYEHVSPDDVLGNVLGGRRDAEGRLTEVLPPGQAPAGVLRESFMHIRIKAQQTAGPEAVESSILKVLGDVRSSVEDFPRMKERCLAIAAELGETPPPLAA